MKQNIRAIQGKSPKIGKLTYIDPAAVVIGDVTIGDDSSIWPMAVVRGDVNYITIGKRTNIQDGAILHVTHNGPYTPGGIPLCLGNDNTIGHGAILHACTITDYCLIGINTVILDGAYIEDHVMIAAGSLVPPGKHLKRGYLYLGNPAREVRTLTPKEREQLEYSASHYVNIKNQYLV